MITIRFACLAVAPALFLSLSAPVRADYISPNIKDRGHEYTDEKASSEFYGTGQGGRLVEASELRLSVDGLLRDRRWEEAIKKSKKAVQLDPGYPEGHLLLARALTGKLYSDKGTIDEKLLADAIREWNIIRFHDADPNDQYEARLAVGQLTRIAKTLEKDRQMKAKLEEKKKAAEALASKPAAAPSVQGDKESVVKAASGKQDGKTLAEVQSQLAEKPKKRWILF